MHADNVPRWVILLEIREEESMSVGAEKDDGVGSWGWGFHCRGQLTWTSRSPFRVLWGKVVTDEGGWMVGGWWMVSVPGVVSVRSVR